MVNGKLTLFTSTKQHKSAKQNSCERAFTHKIRETKQRLASAYKLVSRLNKKISRIKVNKERHVNGKFRVIV